MEQYISKSALVAEIKRLRDRAYELYGCSQFDTAYNNVLKSINTLEVKEVDLEKEYDNEFFKDSVFGKLVNRNAGISIARHFFELGLKAQISYEKGISKNR